MHQRIRRELALIERDKDVAVLYACESGSRAWGFASRDSDYDVRFIYARRPEWYLSIDIEHRRDVIERPMTDELDINGWDLRKAFQLLRKSNPPLLEWLNSPIVYLDRYDVANTLRALVPECYSPLACLWHYLHMAQGNCRDYLRGDTVWVKKYFYVLRPLLAVRWIRLGRGVAPMEFARLVEGVVHEPAVRAAIEELLQRKIAGAELDHGPKVDVLSDFIDKELANLTPAVTPQPPSDIERLNQAFRDILQRVWQPPHNS